MKMNMFLGSFIMTLVISASAFSQTTVVINSNTAFAENQPGWMFNRDATGTFSFGLGNPSIGAGSLSIGPISSTVAADKFIAENFIHTAMSDLNSVSYDFLLGPGGPVNPHKQFYLNVYANFGQSDPLKFYDCRYVVVPTSGSELSFTTVTFNPNISYPVTTRTGAAASPYTCPSVPANMDLLSPGSVVRMFSISVGDSAIQDAGSNGFYDNVVVSTSSGTTIYDFDPQPMNAEQCKKNGWKNLFRANGTGFKNQGDCIQYVNTGR